MEEVRSSILLSSTIKAQVTDLGFFVLRSRGSEVSNEVSNDRGADGADSATAPRPRTAPTIFAVATIEH